MNDSKAEPYKDLLNAEIIRKIRKEMECRPNDSYEEEAAIESISVNQAGLK
jgi:hypothetical protein